MERKVLGKGLEALISTREAISAEEREKIVLLNVEEVIPNRYQPRVSFAEDKLQELIESIKEKGVVQPVIARQNSDGKYELIAGERRLRAVKAAGHKEIPAVVRKATDLELLELSLIENIQRDDLNPIEEARAYESFMKDFGFTQEQISKAVAKNRSTVANMLRILYLPEEIKEAVAKNIISFGHARAILGLQERDRQLELLQAIIKEGFSVRKTEQYVLAQQKQKTPGKKAAHKDQYVAELEQELQHIFGTKVVVSHGKKRGRVEIEYYSLNDLDRILNIIRKK